MPEVEGRWGGHWSYDTNSPLGEPGGFGSVFAGHGDAGAVAVKVVSPMRSGGQVLHPRLHRRELDIVERLRDTTSEHLLRFFDLGDSDDGVFLVMELGEQSLADKLREGMGPNGALDALVQIATGLQDLHLLGIIHRDIKPGNVLRVGNHWKLADFGIARDLAEGTGSPTFLGAGTPPYMAPEIWEGRSPSVKSDLYALGCLAFELLGGAPPFRADSREAYRALHLQERPPTPPTDNPALLDLITRLLTKDPNLRPQDARAVLERLERTAAPLTPAQERLRELAAAHAEERSIEAAREAAERADEEQRAAMRAQALSDLQEICQDAMALLQTALPDLHFHVDPHQETVSFRCDDAMLTVMTWLDFVPLDEADPMIAAGMVIASNRRSPENFILANVVCENVQGRVQWRLYRFRASGLVDQFSYQEYGPRDREHGMPRRVFDDQAERSYMLHPVTHIWQLRKAELKPDSLVDLFGIALELS